MLKWFSAGSRLIAIAIIFATMVTAQPQSNKLIILTVKPDLSLTLGDNVAAREGLAPALEAATAGNHDERIFLRADKAVSDGDLLAVMNALRSAGYLKIALVVDEQQRTVS